MVLLIMVFTTAVEKTSQRQSSMLLSSGGEYSVVLTGCILLTLC